MTEDLARPRFASVPEAAGHYESFYLKLADPRQPRGAWIRYTVLKRPHASARGSLWCTLWTGAGQPPEARKLTFAAGELTQDGGGGALIQIGPGRLDPGTATGAIDDAAWSLEYERRAPPFPYLPNDWMYRTPLPKTKAVSLAPLATFRGQVTVGAAALAVEDWPGMVGHNWGAEHAERWVWLHGAGFAEAPGAWLDVTLGRIKVGPLTLPWIANGGLWIDGRLHRLGGPRGVRATAVEAEPRRCTFTLPGPELTVQGHVEAPPQMVAAWPYSDPTGGEHFSCNCSVATLALELRRPDGSSRSLRLPAGAAYEFGARERPREIPIQPYPDP